MFPSPKHGLLMSTCLWQIIAGKSVSLNADLIGCVFWAQRRAQFLTAVERQSNCSLAAWQPSLSGLKLSEKYTYPRWDAAYWSSLTRRLSKLTADPACSFVRPSKRNELHAAALRCRQLAPVLANKCWTLVLSNTVDYCLVQGFRAALTAALFRLNRTLEGLTHWSGSLALAWRHLKTQPQTGPF